MTTILKKSPSAFRQPLAVASALALLLALGACGEKVEDRTAGQQLDQAISETEKAAAQAKSDTENALSNASEALKDATQSAQAGATNAGEVMGEKLDDAGITTKIKAKLMEDPDRLQGGSQNHQRCRVPERHGPYRSSARESR